MVEEMDAEAAAFGPLAEIFSPLDMKARSRVLQWAVSRFIVEPLKSETKGLQELRSQVEHAIALIQMKQVKQAEDAAEKGDSRDVAAREGGR